MADTALFVARPTDVAALRAELDAARAGSSRTVVLEAPLGGGKRAVVGELVRNLPKDEDFLVVRAQLTDEEDGLRTLLRVYAAVYGALYRDPVLRGKVEMMLNAQLPQHGKRVQGWITAFIDGMKKAVPKEGEESFQVTLPRDNPLVGLVEILSAISRKVNTVVELQNAHNSHSVSTWQLVESLHDARRQGKLLLVLGTEPQDEVAKAWMPAPWLDLLERRGGEFTRLSIAPWGADEVQSFCASKGVEGVAAPGRVAELGKGRPAYVAEVVDRLAELGRLGDSLEGVTLSDLTPIAVNVDDLEDAPAKPGARKHAGAEDADRAQYIAALLGLAFPSGLVADVGEYERDSVDDLFDACPDLVAELQFSKGLGTWVYQFKRGIYRQAVLEAHASDADHELGRRAGLFMERFLVPRGYEFVVKTIRLYAEHGALQRAAMVRSSALATDRPDLWAMMHDAVKYFTTVNWPDPMRRTVYVNLVDRMVQGGDVEQAETLVTEAMKWASDRQDRAMEAWLLFAGSRLDGRRGDLYRARDRAKDALKMYQALDDKGKVAELQNHLAMVEFNDGNVNASLDHLRQALETITPPPPGIVANAEFTKGLIARRGEKFAEAAENFKRSNELAGNAGLAALALEAGFFYGETLLRSEQLSQAADVLARVAQIAQALQNPARERGAAQLLAQTHGRLRNYEAALQMANRTLQLTQELKYERLVAADIYAVAYYQYMLNRPTEALSLFAKAKERAPADDVGFLRELHFHTGLASLKIGETANAAGSLREALKHATTTKAWGRVMNAAEALADIEMARGDKDAAARHLQEALKAAETGNHREERKGIRKKLEELGR